MRRTLGAWSDWEDLEIKQRRIFVALCQLAKARGLSIIFIWRMMADYAEVDDVIIKSSGPVGNPEICVFCEESLLDDDIVKLGEFSCHWECYYETLVEWQGRTMVFMANENHPAVIVVDFQVPGPPNRVILKLAWALGAYRRSLRRPGADKKWIDRTAEDFAVRLVALIEKQLPTPGAIEYAGSGWVF